MNLQQQLDEHQAAIRQLQQQINNCAHTMGDPYRDKDTLFDFVTENQPCGVDFYNPVVTGTKKRQVPVWRRKCTKCGFIQTTVKTEPVITGQRPVF